MDFLDQIMKELVTPAGFTPQQSAAPPSAGMMALANARKNNQQSPANTVGGMGGLGGAPGGAPSQVSFTGGGPAGQVAQTMQSGGSNAGPLAAATAAYQNTQDMRTAGVPGVGGGLMQAGESIFDAIQEPKKREQLAAEIQTSSDAALTKQRIEAERRADSVFELTGDKNLASLAYENPEVARDMAKAAVEKTDSSTMQKEWEYIQSMEDPEQKALLEKKFLESKRTIMEAPKKFGYTTDKDGNMVYAPGPNNPERIRHEKEAAELQEMKFTTAMAQVKGRAKADNVVRQINRSIDNVGWDSAGFAQITSAIPGTPAYTLKQMLDTQQATVAFAELKAMREASKTGGALGNVSNKEIKLLYSSFASLDSGMPPDELMKSLKDIKMAYIAMGYGMDNESQYQLRVANGEMTMAEAEAEMEAGQTMAVNTQMAEAEGTPPEALQILADDPGSIDVFEKEWGWRPRI
jgi:hypothetical protein